MKNTNSDRPLVTFALFAYNQEQYIREAVEGAFSQTYEPLEIILSDDCSTDRTFEVMSELAANYRGPHRVVIRRHSINLQTALHVQSVAEIMSGDLMIVAAGDDVSLPQRTQQMVEAWLSSGMKASVVHGKAIEIDAITRSEIRRSELRPGCDRVLGIEWFLRNKGLPFLSPTCAYSRRIFDRYPPLFGGSVIEDGVLVQRCFLEGPVVPVPSHLILQRVNHQSTGRGFDYKDAKRWNRHVRSRIISALNRLQDLAEVDGFDERELRILETSYKKSIEKLTLFVLPVLRPLSRWQRLRWAARILASYPTGASIIGRAKFALQFTGLMPKGISQKQN